MILSLKKSLAIAALSLLTTTALADDHTVNITNAWARATAPGATKGGAYLSITNTSVHDEKLLSFSSPVAETHEIHEHIHKDGMMLMQEIPEGVDIPAGETAIFKPMGNHLMFIDLHDGLTAGTSFTVTLTFEQEGEVEVSFPVLTPEEGQKMLNSDEMPAMDHGTVDHSKMDHGAVDHSKMDHG